MIKMILSVLVTFFVVHHTQAQDWANLGRYEMENRAVPKPVKGEKRVVWMGDSITDFWIKYDSLFFAGKPYYDRGISGQTTGQMLLRFRPDVINLKPRVVVILAGANDIAENNGPSKLEDIFGNICSMAELAKANGIEVVISSVLPAYSFPWRPNIKPVEKIAALNSMLQAYSKKNGIVYLDYYSAMADQRQGLPPELSDDGVHPNLKGYKLMEVHAEKAVAAALKKVR